MRLECDANHSARVELREVENVAIVGRHDARARPELPEALERVSSAQQQDDDEKRERECSWPGRE